jgi:hypothetical protein
MKALGAYNPGSERVLSSRLLVIDAACEPIKVLKILTQGLAAHTRYGIWLVNCQGVPVARAASEFDLLYLDEQQRVLHGIELSRNGEFEPFRGHAASILILQSKTIARSRTFTGDRIRIDSVESWSTDAEPAPASKLTAHLSAQMVADFSAKSVNIPAHPIPSHPGQDARPTTAAVSDRPMRSGRLSRNRSTIVRPATPPVAAQRTEISQDAPERRVVPIARASAPLPDHASVPLSDPASAPLFNEARSEKAKMPAPEPPPSAPLPPRVAADRSLGAPRAIAPIPHDYTPPAPQATPAAAELHFEPKRTIAPTPRELTPIVPAPAIADVPAKLEQPLVTHSFPASKVASLEEGPTRHQSKIPAKTYTPGGPRQEGPRHELSSSSPDFEATDELERLRKKILAWLYPDGKGRSRRRRAKRINSPGLVGYYFAGGPSTPHEIRNISVMGFYMVMNQRWMPGTILRVTLQTIESDDEGPIDSITVLSRVVRWGPDGGGFEFVIPG